MQRQIKFRQPIFMNGKFNEWHYWGFIDGSFVGPEKSWVSGKESYQLTGLTDKNGNEIWEGDVVSSPIDDDEDKVFLEVIFQDGMFGVMRPTYSNTENGEDYGEEFCSLSDLIDINYWRKEEPEFQVEVIGNCFENPDLLK